MKKRDYSEDLEDEPDHLHLDDPTQCPDAADEITPNAALIVFLRPNSKPFKTESRNGGYNDIPMG